MPGINTEKLHAQAGPAAITHEVSAPGTDTTKSHAQSGTDANTSGGAVSGFGASKFAPRFIGPFTVAERHGSAYTLELPSDMRIHLTFYVGRLKPYVQRVLSFSSCRFTFSWREANLFQHLNTDV
ncbi:hypothetical protein PHMEG_00040631 [Phytophthora megakarya]|uniref:Tf2-1-like SH3-like domain-containing protein n=1 Tax=Phytophthora megakarya TaxID=4795 RepID=A0A225UDJ4_9STRA|nr:hypothetical protein PHMEG_00040631 [Phytophthora megakarya]